MIRHIKIYDRTVEYDLKISNKARRMRISISRNGELSAVIPRFMNSARAEKFIIEKGEWILRKMNYFKSLAPVLEVPVLKNTKVNLKKYKKEAEIFAQKKVEEFNKFYNFKYAKITIRNQKTRWGSCSKKGNLSFNYKIAVIPENMVDYIIVHEICHLGEFNHSQRFWNLVAKTIPDYKAIRKELKRLTFNTPTGYNRDI
ncbi:MAG: SprT family zinc-dependent metalloprotease [bacterium]|nr:SprT family zinc-dependent metalloprotease [bacterium]